MPKLTLPKFATKKDVRAFAKSQYLELSRDQERVYEKQIAIVNQIEALKEFTSAKNILTYYPLKDELDINSLVISNPEKKWCLPRPIGERRMLIFAAGDLFNLQQGKYDIMVPPANNELIKASEIDLVIIPALAYDKKGFRLGRGAGYYDTLLEKLPKNCKTVGVISKELLLDSIPTEHHDQKVDIVISA